MKKAIIIILIFITSLAKGQQANMDSLEVICQQGFAYYQEELPDYAAKTFSRLISIDSSFFKIYYLRAICYIWDAEHPYLVNDKLMHDYNDTTLIMNAMLDLKKSIKLSLIEAKDFPVNYEFKMNKKYKIPDRRIIVLGERYFYREHQDVLDGVLIYITSRGKDTKRACKCWQKAREEHVYKIDILMNEFCR